MFKISSFQSYDLDKKIFPSFDHELRKGKKFFTTVHLSVLHVLHVLLFKWPGQNWEKEELDKINIALLGRIYTIFIYIWCQGTNNQYLSYHYTLHWLHKGNQINQSCIWTMTQYRFMQLSDIQMQRYVIFCFLYAIAS